MVKNELEMFNIVSNSFGKCSIFISHNSYPGHEDDPINMVKIVRIEYQFIDLDDSKKPENSHLDLINLVEWAEKERIPWEASYSGSKGFHFFIKHLPAIYPLKIKLNANDYVELSAYYKASQGFLRSKLNLRCLDIQCAEPKRVHRVWNTEHFKRFTTIATGKWCIPLTIDEILNYTFEEIKQLANDPVDMTNWNEPWNDDKDWYTFSEYLSEYDIHPMMMNDSDNSMVLIADYKSPTTNDDGEAWRWFKKYMPDHCIHNVMFNSRNPPHIARFASAVLWKKAGMSSNWVNQFYEKMRYIDVGNTSNRIIQIQSIFNRGPGTNRPHLPTYEYPSCKRLYEGGICIGPECPKFGRYLKSISDNIKRDANGNRITDFDNPE